MSDIPFLNLLPAAWRGWVLLAAAVIAWGGPYLTRIYHALATNGGIRGAWNAVWFGTNVSPLVASDIKNLGAAVNDINRRGPDPGAVLRVNNQPAVLEAGAPGTGKDAVLEAGAPSGHVDGPLDEH